MNVVRWILTLLFLGGSFAAIEPVPAQESPESVDIAAMPIGLEQMPESGYLIEGGGYLSDAEQVAQFHGAPGGSGTNESNIAGFLQESDWQRSYMYRMVLLADRENPGSDLLADEITLLHEFGSWEEASDAATMLDEFWKSAGDGIDGRDSYSTYRHVAESADSLVTTVAVAGVVAEILSTDFERQPDIADHEAVVAATIERMSQAFSGLAQHSVRVDDMKVTSFFDSPDSFQYYTRVSERSWSKGMGALRGLTSGFQSQQVVTLNNQSQIVIQIWLGTFESGEKSAALLEQPDLVENASPMFADQVVDVRPEIIDELKFYTVRGSSRDGVRATGYRAYLTADEGKTVGIVSLIAYGNVLIDPADMAALTKAQQECLDAVAACATISLNDIIVADESGRSPEASPEGTYTDPQFGWTVDYADAGWEISSVEGDTILELQQGRSLASVETVVDRHGDPTRCILEEVRLLEEFEEHGYITLGSDFEGEPRAGNEPGHVWAIYTVEPLADERADQEYTVRIDCYTLIEGDISLVVHHSAPRDLWESESAKGDDLRANIDTSGVAAATSDGADAQVRNVDVLNLRIWIPLAA